ncbi:MAG: glycoside hydrolase family 127 protein, partial [Curtobacterium sp.]
TLRVPGSAPSRHEQAAWPYRRIDASRPGGTVRATDAASADDVTGGAGGEPRLPADTASTDTAHAVTATAVPYYAWANRGSAPMRVWLPIAR